MRNIVFSFDDGLFDFKENALPILEKFGFKASVNVITNYSELGSHDGFKYLTITDLCEIGKKGFELACHTDTHQERADIDDLLTCKKKMAHFFGNNSYGLILPFSQPIDKEKADFILSKFLYLADYKTNRLKNNSYYLLSKLMVKLCKKEKYLFYYRNYSYFYSNSNNSRFFKRLPIKSDISPKIYINFLKHMPNNTTLVLMFHSITRNGEKCPWPEGSWTVDNFDYFLSYLDKRRSKFRVVTQRSLIDE